MKPYLPFLLFLFLFLFSAHPAKSQESTDDVVYMNNGSFIRGKILQMEAGKTLTLLVGNKDTLEIRMSDVKLVMKEKIPVTPVDVYANGFRAWGYTCILELTFGAGVLEGLDRYKDTACTQYSLMISVSNGFTISPFFYLGIELGGEKWGSRMFLPVCLDLRSNILKAVNSPFFYLNTGYSLGWIVGQKGAGFGGAALGLGAGAKFRISKQQVMMISLGYRFQQTREWIENNSVDRKATRDSHFICLKTGITF
jgi:hypothetical protein